MVKVVSFNGKEIPDFIRVTGISFPVFGELNLRETAIPRRYGNVDNKVKVGGAPYSLDVVLIHDSEKSIHEQAEELKRWLIGDNWKPSKLIFSDQPNKYVLARASGNVEIKDLFIHGEGTLDFYAANPTKYDTEQTVHTESVSLGEDVVIPYVGLQEAPSVVSVTLGINATNLVLTHEESGNFIKVLGTLVNGDVLTIDNNKKLIKLNGVNAMKNLTFGSNWFYLKEGTNTLNLTADAWENPDNLKTELKVTYRRGD